jgi:uncharacterized protein YxjI
MKSEERFMDQNFVTRQVKATKATTDIEIAAVEGKDLSAFDAGFELDLSNAEAVEAYSLLASQLEARQEFYAKQAEEMDAIAKQIGGVLTRYNTFVKKVMSDAGTTDLTGVSFRYKLTTVKPRLVVEDETKLSEYTKTETKVVLDKERIKQDLELGVPVEGARLEQSHSLRKYPIKGLK